jgi:transposase
VRCPQVLRSSAAHHDLPVLGDRFVRSFDPTFEPKEVVGGRRLEVITGVGGRRAWSHEDKGRIVAESFAAEANVAAVARRYGLRPQQVYAWRRLARGGALALPAEEPLGFVPVVAAQSQPIPSAAAAPTPAGIVEIEISGAVIRAAPGVDWRHLREVLRAVKAAR